MKGTKSLRGMAPGARVFSKQGVEVVIDDHGLPKFYVNGCEIGDIESYGNDPIGQKIIITISLSRTAPIKAAQDFPVKITQGGNCT